MNTSKLFTLLKTAVGCSLAATASAQQPNVVLIISDQHNVSKLSYLGDEQLQTPNLDALARDGYMYTNGYCAHPLSVPSRFSMFTGRYPADYGVRFNPDMSPDKQVDYNRIAEAYPTALGNLFANAGYETFYAGKEHLPAPSQSKNERSHNFYGFPVNITPVVREPLSQEVADFLNKRDPESAPFLLVVSYLNPHDICEFDDYLFYDKLSEKERTRKADKIADVADQFRLAQEKFGYPSAEFYKMHCPDLPANFADTEPRPGGLKGRTKKYTDDQWRMYRWVYNRLIEQVDEGMGVVLEALKNRGLDDNTIVVYISDHGDMMGAHSMEQKSAPYGECQQVPLIIRGPGVKKGIVDRSSLSNTGIDLLPTLCDFAGISIPEDMPGISLKNTAVTGVPLPSRYVYPSANNWFQVVGERYKYTIFESEAAMPELLVDLEKDPGELVNLVEDPAYANIRAELRAELLENLGQRGIQPKIK